MATETDKGLEDIRREVIESRNLVIKTDNLLKNLHAELKVVGKRQEDFARRQWISSAVAYLGFLGLCVVGSWLVSNARMAAAGADREKLEKQLAEVSNQVERLRSEAATAQAADQRAAEVYKQMTTLTGDDRLRAIDAFSRLDASKLSVFAQRALQDRAGLLRKEIGGAIFERGMRAYRKSEWAPASEELARFLTLSPSPDEANDATYALGHALFQQRKHEQAAPVLQRYVDGAKTLKNRDYAMLMLVQAYDAVAQKEKALTVSREALADHPASEFAPGFRNRLKRAEAEKPAPAPALPSDAPVNAADPSKKPLSPPLTPRP